MKEFKAETFPYDVLTSNKRTILSKDNKKFRETEDGHEAAVLIYSFSITRRITCPFKGVCSNYCYVQNMDFRTSVAKSYEKNRQLTQIPEFVDFMTAKIQKLKKRNANVDLYIRLHVSGDFYSPEYIQKWFAIARNCPNVNFYAYTKSVQWILNVWDEKPENLMITFSFGGLQDYLIPEDKKHAIVIDKAEDLPAGYVIGNKDDLLMYTHDRIAFVKH